MSAEQLTINIHISKAFYPLVKPARYKAAHGGRGSGKSHFFAEKLIDDSLAEPSINGEGLLSVCIREVQKDLAQSSKLLIENKLTAFGLTESDGFSAELVKDKPIFINIALPSQASTFLLKATVLRKQGDQLVLQVAGMLKCSRYQEMDMLDAIELKANLLQHPSTQQASLSQI